MPNFREIADRLINYRHIHVKRRVRKALEKAYQSGLDEAAAEFEAAAKELADQVRQLGQRPGHGPQLIAHSGSPRSQPTH